jgi:hypothetical protein
LPTFPKCRGAPLWWVGMAYEVEGIIARYEALEWHWGELGWLKIVPLNQGFGIAPITDFAWDMVSRRFSDAMREQTGRDITYEVDVSHDLWKLCWVLADWLERFSLAAPIAVIQITCHGGDCEHGASVWKDGRRLFAPGKMESNLHQSFDNPVNQALRAIGVEVGGAFDAFAAVGLGQYRSRDDWEEAAE